MLKLLQLNVTANWGSTGKIAEGIGQAAMAAGWESAIAYGRYSNPSQSQLIKVGNQADVYAHYARARFLDGEGLGSLRATKRLIEKFKNYQPDIIHLHNIHDHWLNYPLLFEYLASVKTPVVWTFHDCWAFTGHCSHFENSGCFKWRNQCYDCPLKAPLSLDMSARNYNLKKEYFEALGKRLTIVPCSRWLADYVKESFLGNCNIEVINNGIDTNLFSPSDAIKKEKMILGASNVWPDYKGLPDFKKLRELLPPDINITLVGLTAKQVSELPAGIKGVERTGNVHELIELYRRASAFVNPTHNDTFPTVNLEALACGTPVITYNTGGSPEAIDENTGIVVTKGDVYALAEAVLQVIEHTFSSEACCKRAVENFNKDRQFGKYITLYNSILNSRS